jgi:hypothetical protein
MTTSTQTQLRRGTNSQCIAMTPAAGEPIVDTTNNRLSIGNGSTAGGIPHVTYADQQKQKFTYPSVGGTGNAITLTNIIPVTAYGNGLSQVFKANANNVAGACAANSDSLGSRSIKLMLGGSLQDPPADSIVSGGVYELLDDGTQFQLKGTGVTTPSVSGMTLLAVQSGAQASYDFSGLTNAYDNYVFVLENVLQSSSGSDLIARVRRSGQGSYDSGGGQYFPSDNGDSGINLMNHTISSNIMVSGTITAHGIAQANRCVFLGNLAKTINTGAAPVVAGVAGQRNTTTALDGVQFLFSSGTISSGAIYMYGLKNSV